jgi:hypothetical protein
MSMVRSPRLTPRNVRRAIALARVVGPIMTPYAIKAAGYARHRWDLTRARRLGVPIEQLASFSGRGTALHARLYTLATALDELSNRRGDDVPTTEFVQSTQTRMADLSAALRMAEQMPAARRKAAHRAVTRELDEIESKLLSRLGF